VHAHLCAGHATVTYNATQEEDHDQMQLGAKLGFTHRAGQTAQAADALEHICHQHISGLWRTRAENISWPPAV
jgi:hypothetical protein